MHLVKKYWEGNVDRVSISLYQTAHSIMMTTTFSVKLINYSMTDIVNLIINSLNIFVLSYTVGTAKN